MLNDLRYLRLRFIEWQPVLFYFIDIYFVKPLKELNFFLTFALRSTYLKPLHFNVLCINNSKVCVHCEVPTKYSMVFYKVLEPYRLFLK